MRILLFIVVLTGFACDASEPPAMKVGSIVSSCSVQPGGSRWLPQSRGYRLVAEYGRAGGQEFGDIWGVDVTPSGNTLVFDPAFHAVIELGPGLSVVRRYGRDGSGPGEFGYQKALHGDWLAVDGTSFLVLDYRAVQRFQIGGDFSGFVSRAMPDLPAVRSIEVTDVGLVYGVDLVDGKSGMRRFEVRRMGDSVPHPVIRTDSMPRLPLHAGRFVRGVFADQGEPVWAARGRCAFVSDGSSPWLLRIDLGSGEADTLPLPSWERPPRTDADRMALERMRTDARMVGISAGSSHVEPTAPIRWVGLVVDPDGYIWVEPWRPRSQQNDALPVLIVDPSSGDVDTIRVPRFPDGFLPNHAYMSIAYDTALGVQFLEKYTEPPVH